MAAAGAAFRSGAGKTPFADVPAGAWYEDAAAFVYEAGLMQGTSGTAFSPDRVTTRGQIAAILHRLEGEPGRERRPSPMWSRRATVPRRRPGRQRRASSWAMATVPSGRTSQSPASSWRPSCSGTWVTGARTHRPGGPEPISGQRRCGGLRPGGSGLGGVRRAAPGPVRRDPGPLRLRHPGPDGGAAPAAGHAAGRKRIETSKQETAGGGLLFLQACGIGRRGRPVCRPVDQGPVPCAVGAAICRPGDNGAGNAGA